MHDIIDELILAQNGADQRIDEMAAEQNNKLSNIEKGQAAIIRMLSKEK